MKQFTQLYIIFKKMLKKSSKNQQITLINESPLSSISVLSTMS